MITYRITLTRFLIKVQICCMISCFLGSCRLDDLTNARVRAEALEAHVRFLSDDLLAGRYIGSQGERMAAKYIHSQLRLAGIEEVTLQPVPLLESTVAPGESYINVDPDNPYTYGVDYMLVANPNTANYSIQSPIVFAGYGISAPEAGWDDYKNLNVSGKIVAVLFGTPSHVAWSNGNIDYYTTWNYKTLNALEHGAAGMLIIWTDTINKSFPWHFYVRENSMRYDWLDEEGKPSKISTQNYYLGGLSNAGILKILSSSSKEKLQNDMNLEEAYNQGLKFEIIPDTATIKIKTSYKRLESYNVVGRIAGGRGQTDNLVITAHMDGKGTFHDRSGDTIRNGAVDNAAGVAVLLEMARAIASQPKKQLKNMIFVATSGKESGFTGSSYFVNNFKEGKIIGAINIDEPAILFSPTAIVARGAEHSSLRSAVNLSIKKLNYKLIGDPLPNEHFFIRGDSYEFVKAGIPSVWLMAGFDSSDKSINGEKISRQWRQKYYHQASDDIFQPLNFNACAEFANLNLVIALTVANDPGRPTWNEGNIFGEIFGSQK